MTGKTTNEENGGHEDAGSSDRTVREKYDATEDFKQGLRAWADKHLTEEDWETTKSGPLLRIEACEALARHLDIHVKDVTERPMEYRPNAKWLDGQEPVATVFVTLVDHYGRTFIRGGKFSGSEVEKDASGKYDESQLLDHWMFATAHSRAYRLALREAVGGFGAIEPAPIGGGGQTVVAAVPPHVHLYTGVQTVLHGPVSTPSAGTLRYLPCACGAVYEPPMKPATEPPVETLMVETERSKFDKGGGASVGDYNRTHGVYIRRGFDPKKHVLRKNNSIGLQASVAEWLVKNGCGLIVLEESGGEQPPVWRVVDFWAFLTNCKFETLNPADGPQLFAPAKLFEETAERPEWKERGTSYTKVG